MDFIFHIVKSFPIVSTCALLAKIKNQKSNLSSWVRRQR